MLPIEAAAAAVAISRQLESGYHAPLVWRWPFAGEREEGATARRFVRYLLTGFPAVNDVEQVAGELIANALTHTRAVRPAGGSSWRSGAGRRSPRSPLRTRAARTSPRLGDGAVAEHGYGLLTVRALACWWGWYGDTRSRRDRRLR